jgi:hypothetical protein
MKRHVKIVCAAWLLIAGSATLNKAGACMQYDIKKPTITSSDTISIELLHIKKNSSHLLADGISNKIIFTNSLYNHPLEFYVFDLEGTLIHQTVLNPKDKKNITALNKGIYLYDLFFKDESIERGKIIIK